MGQEVLRFKITLLYDRLALFISHLFDRKNDAVFSKIEQLWNLNVAPRAPPYTH